MTVPPDDSADRLREPPSERFAGTAHLFDLAEALRKLRSEDHPPKDGHRQITILHRAPVGHVLFAFEPGGRLAEHSARGEVAIHVLEGHLVVEAEGRDHDLPAGHILYLGPGVPHDVRALQRSAMLLSVHKVGSGE